MMAKNPKASPAQAEFLANIFGGHKMQYNEHYASGTEKRIVRNKWVSATGQSGLYPSGAMSTGYAINAAGEKALEDYLRQRRCARQDAKNIARALQDRVVP